MPVARRTRDTRRDDQAAVLWGAALPGGRAELAKRPDLFAAALPQGIHDARRTFDVLSSRSEVDPEKLGVTGISLGGIISATTAASDPRVQPAVLLLAGGDLPSIIHHGRETRPISDFLKCSHQRTV